MIPDVPMVALANTVVVPLPFKRPVDVSVRVDPTAAFNPAVVNVIVPLITASLMTVTAEAPFGPVTVRDPGTAK